MSLSKQIKNKGFALLITLVVISVVLAIGLSLLFVTTKQYLLAVTANESEKAFQIAQVGLECMRYHRAQPDTRNILLKGINPPEPPPSSPPPPPSLSCAGVNSNIVDSSGGPILSISSSDYWVYSYKYRYTINNRCVEPSLYIADLRQYDGEDPSLPIANEGLESIECKSGSICTAIFSRGYNRPCDQLDSILTIQREITVEY